MSVILLKKGSCQLLRKYVHEVLVNRLGGLSLPRKSVVRLTDHPNMTLDVYRGRKTTMQHYLSSPPLLFECMKVQDQLLHYPWQTLTSINANVSVNVFRIMGLSQ